MAGLATGSHSSRSHHHLNNNSKNNSSDVTNEHIENWVKEWPCLAKYAQRTGKGQGEMSTTLRKLTNGPMRHVLAELFVPRVKTTEWIRNQRLNLSLEDGRMSSESSRAKQEQADKMHVAKMEALQKELDSLTEMEENLRLDVQTKQKKLCAQPSTRPQPESCLDEMDLSLMKKSTLLNCERILAKSAPFLETLEASESSKAGRPNCREERQKVKDGLAKDNATLQARRQKKEDFSGVGHLEFVVSKKVGVWSQVHIQLRGVNENARARISAHPIPKLIKSEVDEFLKLLIEHENLKAQLVLYTEFAIEPFVKALKEKMMEKGLTSNSLKPVDPTHKAPTAGVLVDTESVEDQLIAMVKSWSHFKAHVRRTQKLVKELQGSKLERVGAAFEEVAEFRVVHPRFKFT